MSLEQRVNDFVQWLFSDYRTVVHKQAKVINDAILGNQHFSAHEVVVIDCPLLQRLKRIRQTGLVYQVFPSANHSRFEHSLGAVTVAERSFTAIMNRTSVEYPRTTIADADRLSGDLAHLRMAALLHDVGHGLCSHASEQIYELLSDMREFRDKPIYTKNSPGEILSYLMVLSPQFKEWFIEYVVTACHAQINLELVGKMILGQHPDKNKYFLAQIVSSPYDADKLDYIARDSYYCGLALTVDLPRFYSMISTAVYNEHRILVLRNYVPLEQIMFSKMTLFGSVYHHQKVKCLDCMLHSLVQHVSENPDQCAFVIRGKRIGFTDPVEYLYLTDDEFFSRPDGFGDDYVRKMLRRFQRRDLFVRCLEISRRTVTNWNNYGRKKLVGLSEKPKELMAIERHIHTVLSPEIRKQCNLGEIKLSVPSIPRLKGDFAFIQSLPDTNVEFIEEFFPVEQWIDSYAHNKWKCYVYGPREHAQEIRDASRDSLKEATGLIVDAKKSNYACHL